MISKKKVIELARHSSLQGQSLYSCQQHWVMNIKCAEDHLVLMEDEYGRAPLKNCILEMLTNELSLDCHYLSTRNTILVHVDKDTLDRIESQPL